MKKKLLTLIFALTLLAITSATKTFAQTTNPCPGGGIYYRMTSVGNADGSAGTPFFDFSFFNTPCFEISEKKFSNIFQDIFNLAIGLTIVLAVIMFMYAAATGIIKGDSAKGVIEGKNGMKNALISLILVLSSWLIINTINPDLIRLPLFEAFKNISVQSAPSQQPASTQVSSGADR